MGVAGTSTGDGLHSRPQGLDVAGDVLGEEIAALVSAGSFLIAD